MQTDAFKRLFAQRGWLSRTPEDFRTALLDMCTWEHHPAGEPLFYSGDPAGGLYGIAAGMAEMASAFANDDAYMVHLFHPGGWTGEAALLSGVTRQISMAARTDLVVAHASRPALMRLFDQHPGWWRHVGSLAQQNCATATAGGIDMMLRDNSRRCIAQLLRLSGCRYRNPAQGEPAEIIISQDELAAVSNLSRNAVGDILRKLAADKMIELGYRSITILAPALLRRLVESG